jgi:membrane protein
MSRAGEQVSAEDQRAGAGRAVAPDRGVDAERPAEIPPRGWFDVAKRVKAELRDDHSALSAAGVAYFGFLSIIPGLAAVISVYALVASPAQIRRRMSDALTALPSDARHLLTSQLTRLSDRSSGALGISLLISIAVAIWSASSGMAHLIEAIGIAYDEGEGRGFVRRRGQAILFTIAVMVVGVVGVTAIAVVPRLVDDGPLRWVLRVAVWVAVALAALVGLAALYRFGPDRDDPRWRWVTPGSLIALVLVVAASVGLQVYAANFGSYSATYGGLAAVVLLLLWMYLVALLTIVGAQINAELEHQTAEDTTRGPEQPMGTRGAEMADTVARQPS